MSFSFLSGAIQSSNTGFNVPGYILPSEVEKTLGNPISNGQVLASNTDGVRYWTSNISFAFTANSANFANSASFLGGRPEANLNVNSATFSTNAQFAFTSNSASFLSGKPEANLNVNSATFSTNSSFAYDANNAFRFDGKLPEYYTNATNLSTGTIAEPRLPFRMNQNVTSSSSVEFHNVVLTGTLSVANGVTVITANNFSITDNMIYFNNGILATITNVSGNGSVITFTANNNFRTGWDVYVSGVIPDSWNGLYHNIIFANATHFQANSSNNFSYTSGGLARGKTDVNPDLGFAAGYNDGTYHHAGFFRDHTNGTWKVFDSYVPEPDVSIYIDQDHPSFRNANFMANTIFVGNNTVFATITPTNFTGTSNNATHAYSKTEGNLNVNAAVYSTNANFAYTANTSNLLNGKAENTLSVNSANSATYANNANFLEGNPSSYFYQASNPSGFANSTVGTAFNAANLNNKSESALNVNSANSTTYANNANFLEGNPALYFYQASNPSGFANSTVGTAFNASNLNNQPASYYTNATNITTGTLQSTVIPSYVVNTSGSFTFSNNLTFNANITIGATGGLIFNSGAKLYDTTGSQGTAGQVLASNGSGNLYWTSMALLANNENFINTTASYTFTSTAVHTHQANIVIDSTGAIVFNTGGKFYDYTGSQGSDGQVLTSNGSIPFWKTPSSLIKRTTTYTSNNTFTAILSTTDIAIMSYTAASSNPMTIANTNGVPIEGQSLVYRIQSTNPQTLSFDSQFSGSIDLPLPSLLTGSSKYDYLGFIWNDAASKWQLLAKNFGF
jgi:hypothetical protein